MKGSGTPIWDDLASSGDLAVLDPGPHAFFSGPEVLVVGGGVIGLSVAAACTAAGMSVLLVERGRLAGQASGRAAGGLSPDAHPELGPVWRAHAKHSLELHRELDERYGYGLRDLDLRVGQDLVIPDQAHVDPLRLCASLARRAGAVATGVDVAAADRGVVSTSAGDVHPRAIVFATGVAPAAAGAFPQSFVRGHLIATEAAPAMMDEIFVSADLDILLLQLPTGHLVAGGTKDHGTEDPAVDDEIALRIADVWPQIEQLRITYRWTCFRPSIAGDLPLLRRISEETFVAAGFYSTGILMAPVVGELIRDAIAGERAGIDDLLER